MRGDEQEPDMRCGTLGTSGHATTKSSIRSGVCFINPAFTHRKFGVLLREVCMASKSKVGMQEGGTAGKPGGNREHKPRPAAMIRTERGEIPSDRHAEVSRGHSACLAARVSGGLKSRAARDHGPISKGGGNASPAGERGRYGEPYTGTKAKAGHSQGGPEATLSQDSGGQGAHREVGSEGLAENHRVVIEGRHPQDEPVGQRWGMVEPALWRRRRLVPPHRTTVCVDDTVGKRRG
jgi:hypothetical protein